MRRLIAAFLDDLEKNRGITIRSRNLRLTAIRSFFHYAAYEEPSRAAQIQRVLAIPGKRHTRNLVHFLDRPEIDALLAAPDQQTWFGRRDHALLLVAVQTGLRLSELTGLQRADVVLGRGAHVRCVGKGRKERCTPLAKTAVAVLKAWLREPPKHRTEVLFPTARGGRLSPDSVADLAGQTRSPRLQVLPVSPEKARHPACAQALDGHGAVAGGRRSSGHRSLAGARVGGDHADLPRSQPRHEGGDSGKDHAAQRQARSLPAW